MPHCPNVLKEAECYHPCFDWPCLHQTSQVWGMMMTAGVSLSNLYWSVTRDTDRQKKGLCSGCYQCGEPQHINHMWSTSRFRVGSAGQFPAWSTVALLDKDNNVYYTQSTGLTVINRLPTHCVNRRLIKVCVFFLTNIARRDIWRGLNYTQISQNNVLSKIDYPKPEDNGWQQQFIQYKRSSDWLTIVVTETYLTCSN